MSGTQTPTIVSSLFSETDVTSVRRDRLCNVASTYFPKVVLDDAYILEMLQVAEAELQRDLGCYFTPRQVAPNLSTPAQLEAIQAANPTAPIIQEPGYDYDPKLFNGESWGFIQLRQKPIIAIQQISFNYPAPTDVAYTIPQEWIRPDLKYGTINLLPIQTNASLPLNAYFLSVLGGGNIAPFLMQIAYTCGMANARQDYPDLVNLIKRLAVCEIIENQFLPQSGSVSGDGISQSLSLDISKYRDSIETITEKLRNKIHGVRLAVC